ncbi:FAD-linked oxidase C-terminal domain-containing protein, partial [Klebsiella aerogenes]|uniref:FAD-linked oxidase C-terminal domain-containing protein n=1 Tax=Klebsiella aerogenes TaxID=548 RepID=UPI0030D8FFA6
AKAHDVKVIKESKSAMETAAIWKGRKSAFGATGRVADYICMDGTIPTGRLPEVLAGIDRIVKGYGLRVAN